jgi:predicted nucleic acid-binding protein
LSPFDDNAAGRTAEIRADPERRGIPIGGYDLDLMAAG